MNMTTKTRWGARLAAVGVATTAIAAGTLLTAAPAHADRARDCQVLMAKAEIAHNLYEWYGIALGYDSRQAQAYLGQAIDASDFWMEAC
jgi:hypothetical protein